MSAIGRLYRNETNIDFIGRRKTWYALSAALLALSAIGLLVLKLNLGIDFTGGAVFQFTAPTATQERVTEVVEGAGGEVAVYQDIGSDDVRVQTEELEPAVATAVTKALAEEYDLDADDVSPSTVGAKFGDQVRNKALRGLFFFLVLVVVYISLRFEWKMAVAAFVAVFHDLFITAGIYALSGFEVTPSTVIALLTILGYSLYDTVVIFDRVREDTQGLAGGSRMTYSDAANSALNETVMRSLNTSLTSLIPVGVLLFVGAGLLGAGTLKDLALALFIGLAVSTYSSIFVATPVLVALKEREPQFKALAARVRARQASGTVRTGGRLATAGAPAGMASSRVADVAPGVSGGLGASGVSDAVPEISAAPRPASPVRGRTPPPPKRKGGRSGRPGRPSGKKRR
ncbi:MAG TPA: protein translocase subunit SecF [Mycobacteriales bacterium]|nr:protein translocase subunit SecF [Mycobacteriales bacterium]